MNTWRLLLPLVAALCAAASAQDYERALSIGQRTQDKVFRTRPEIHWLPGGANFWYSVKTGATAREWVLVNAENGEVKRTADAAALGLKASTMVADAPLRSRASDERMPLRFVNHRTEAVEIFWLDFEGRRKPSTKLAAGESRAISTFAGHVWLIVDAQGHPLARRVAGPELAEIVIEQDWAPLPSPARDQPRRDESPDGKWAIRFEKEQCVLRDLQTGESTALTTDGTPARPYRGPAAWSPDSQSFVVLAVREAPGRKVTLIESSPPDQVQPKVRTISYLKPGDELPRPQPVLFHLGDRQPRPIETTRFPTPFTPDGRLPVRWAPDSQEFYFDYNQRGHQLYRILAVNTATGTVRTVVEETAKTFIDYTRKTQRHWLPQTHELIWMSERDGWCHLWLYDTATGQVRQPLTSGAWVVRDLLRVDEQQRVAFFLASGLRAEEDPYHQHLCRVRLDGSDFRRLTEGDGNHAIEFSPDGRFFIDSWSRADAPPVTELRRSDDGRLVASLERADATALVATGWTMPERFVAKARDGQTDIHGVIIKPSHFDPSKKYPVLEQVYAGPHGAFAPKDFSRLLRQHEYAELGFIVVQADGMGTNYRGKAFHDVAWQNLADAGFPDRIAWIKAAAASRPWMDLSRVGIYGGSAGGQNAMRALLDHNDFYQAAFADCGCHDNRMDKIWWNEQWLGWPVGEAYTRSSNVVDAAKLRGALTLCVGELDENVDPASTMQVVHALQKAGKDFDYIVIAGAGHGAAETPYGNRRRMEFFVRELLGGRR